MSRVLLDNMFSNEEIQKLIETLPVEAFKEGNMERKIKWVQFVASRDGDDPVELAHYVVVARHMAECFGSVLSRDYTHKSAVFLNRPSFSRTCAWP